LRLAREFELAPNIHQDFGEAIDQRIIVIRRRRDPYPLQASRHRWIVDGLDIDAVFRQQQLARRRSFFPAADTQRHNGRGLQF
jgi:hypothetical protein